MKIRRINKTHKVQREEAENKQLDPSRLAYTTFGAARKTAAFKDKNVKKNSNHMQRDYV